MPELTTIGDYAFAQTFEDNKISSDLRYNQKLVSIGNGASYSEMTYNKWVDKIL